MESPQFARQLRSEAMEITTFRLRKGLTLADFIAANADVDRWLHQQPGFILRRICEADDGRVIDMLLWASAADGRRAAARIMTELAHSPVHAVIDQATVQWAIQDCQHRVDKATGAGRLARHGKPVQHR